MRLQPWLILANFCSCAFFLTTLATSSKRTIAKNVEEKMKNKSKSYEYKIASEFKKNVLNAFKNRCCNCNERKGLIAVRILKDKRKRHLSFDIRNSQLLCTPCRKIVKKDIRSNTQKERLSVRFNYIFKSDTSRLGSAYRRSIQDSEIPPFIRPEKIKTLLRKKVAVL